MAELTSNPVWADPILPKALAFPVLVKLMLTGRNDLVFPMGESALISVVAVSEL